jgi:hypothetical protein
MAPDTAAAIQELKEALNHLIEHQTLISMKVPILETLLIELLTVSFLRAPDPVAGAIEFAERHLRPIRDRLAVDSDARLLAAEAVWSEFLDRLVASVQRQAR